MEYNAAPLLTEPNHARVLVVGPMGAGKTSLVNSLCRYKQERQHLGPPRPTIGCNVDVKLLPGECVDRSIEFWDIGGHPDAAPARRMFVEDSSIAGVLLVFDLSNTRSARELRAWIKDLTSAGIDVGASRMPHEEREFDFMAKLLSSLKRDDAKSASSIPELMALLPGASDTDLEGCAGTVPVRFVGTRRDVLAPSPRGGEDVQAEFSVPRTPHIWVSAPNLNKGDEEHFHKFFEDVFRYHAAVVGSCEGGRSPITARERGELRHGLHRPVQQAQQQRLLRHGEQRHLTLHD